ncbi:DEAD/DEAH box helicase family protein [Photobacterium leiognathi]|uniref:SNF2-related protein n=1 Tax=Photobacterium leiognathi TaxID=553611 RepID=UPI001EDDDD79|nr:SNF2-related protein [Photobacterium leiognathi]MCG3884171.1 DEAD/DEAH box helicase family protein [Photobacterium leiognathi]
MNVKLSTAINEINSCVTIKELLSVFDKHVLKTFGVTDNKISLAAAKKLRQQANAKAVEILERVKSKPEQLTEEDKSLLRAYTGGGGLGEDTTNEYYTPQFVASGMWDSLLAMGFNGGNTLEPSAGAGVFSGTKPPATEMTAVELNGTSGAINQLLNPTDKVIVTNFEKVASVTPDNTYDNVIGNPPFGDRAEFAKDDKEFAHINSAERYFIERSIKLCKAGGLIAMALPTRVIDRVSWSDWRKELSYKAEFLGGWLLPAGTFNANGTGTTVAVCFWRKHGDEITEQLENTDEKTLYAANVLRDDYISGKYFEKSGKKYVMGELGTKKGMFGKLETNVKGEVDPSAIRSKLAQPFHSLIDWSMLALSEPVSEKYTDGDKRKINGILKELKDGEWVVANTHGQNGDSLDPTIYGYSSLSELRDQGFNSYFLSNLSVKQLKAVKDNFSGAMSEQNASALNFIFEQKEKYQSQIKDGVAIGVLLSEYRALRARGQDDFSLRDEIVNKAQAQFNTFGHPHETKALIGLTGDQANLWNDFCECLDAKGNPSEFLQGELDTCDTQSYDSSNPSSVVDYLASTIGNEQITLDDINEFCDNQVDLDYILADKSLAVDANGYITSMEKLCSGDVVAKRDQLISAIGKAARTGKRKNAATINKWQEQLDQIDAKRAKHWQSLDDVKVTLNSPWLDKSVILDFLADNGYTEFKNGGQKNLPKSDNKIGSIWGYRYDESGKLNTHKDFAFHRHLENYLNGKPVDAKDNLAKSEILGDIHALNTAFNDWIKTSVQAKAIEQQYNDKYNRYLDFKYSNKDLELKNTSGDIKLMDYQNEAIRQLAEDGRGLLGFQMGLGKTFTALGLVAYNEQTNRFKRTAIVVPKSTYENWYHEHTAFFGHSHQQRSLFVGIAPVIGKDGKIEQTPILDSEGKETGKFRDVVRELSSAEIAANMAKIPHSNYSQVIMTKEQFARIPMRPTTKDQYVSKMVGNENIRSTRIAMDAVLGGDTSKMKDIDIKGGYANAKKQASFRRRYSDEGTEKSGAFPFFEDMLFDNVVVDEAHNYRNSYQSGREASKLAWLPTASSAKSSLDMTMKLDHIKQVSNGKGSFLLTATPTVNSPTDIYNMLSLVIGADEWMEKYNVANVDDFIKLFGDTEIKKIEKLSGAFEYKEALVGFDNLGALQNLFHRWCNVKDAKAVGKTVKIPNLDTKISETPMSEEQAAIYEELRQQADEISKASTDEERAALQEQGITVFGIIRKMDKVACDLDLYNGTITYLFNSEDEEKVRDLVSKLPKSLTLVDGEDDKDTDLGDGEKAEKFKTEANAKVSNDGKHCKLVVNSAYEEKVQELLKKCGIDESTITHPINGKYAALIENVNNGLKDGKQIIFSEEKTQHEKIKRILLKHTDLKASQIGIINSDAIKKAQGDDGDELSGLEVIAADFNEGRKLIVIANKKAEVGINLHRGTTDVHHLTIPWTPASLRQKNGRAARVGSTADTVRCWVYSAKDSFDEFRYQTMERKSNWINEVLTTTESSARNANADDMAMANDCLAKNDEERQKNRAQRLAEAEAKQKAEALKRAQRQLEQFINANNAASLTDDNIKAELSRIDYQIEQLQPVIAKESKATNAYKLAASNLRAFRDTKRRLLRTIKLRENAENTVKQLRPMIERYIDNGTLDIDKSLLEKGNTVALDNGNVITVGSTWRVTASKKELMRQLKRSYGWDWDKNVDNVSTADRHDETQELIIRVRKCHQDRNFCECSILHPFKLSIYGNGNHLRNEDGETAVFLDNFIEKVNFTPVDMIEKNLVETINDGSLLTMAAPDSERGKKLVHAVDFDLANEIIAQIGLERFNKILNEHNSVIRTTKQQETYGKYGRTYVTVGTDSICYSNGEFKLFAYKEIPFEDRMNVLVPAMLTGDLKNQFGNWLLTLLSEKNAIGSNYEAGKYVPIEQVDALLGKGWLSNLEDFGEKLSKTELCSIAESVMNKYRDYNWNEKAVAKINEVKGASYSSSYTNPMVADFTKLITDEYYAQIDAKYLNKSEQASIIRSAIDNVQPSTKANTAYTIESNRIKAEKEAMENAQVEYLQSVYDAWKNSTADEAKKRLIEYAELKKELWDSSIAEKIESYDLSDSDKVDKQYQLQVKVAADLAHFKDFEPITITKSFGYELSNYVYRFTRAFNDGIDPLVIDEPLPLATEQELNAPLSDSDLDLTGALTEMIVKLNQNEIDVPARQIKKGRAKKTVTQPAKKFAAKTVIGIQDPDGYKGRLSELFKGRNNTAKAKYNAEWFDRDDASELNGGFWLVPASTDLNELAKEFETL